MKDYPPKKQENYNSNIRKKIIQGGGGQCPWDTPDDLRGPSLIAPSTYFVLFTDNWMKKQFFLKKHNRQKIYTVRIFLSYCSDGTYRPDQIFRLRSRRAEIFFLILHSIPKGSLYTRYYLSSYKIRSKDVNGLKGEFTIFFYFWYVVSPMTYIMFWCRHFYL